MSKLTIICFRYFITLSLYITGVHITILRPEEIQYLDASFLGKSSNEKLKWNLTAFIYDVKDAITTTITQNGFNQLINERDYITLGGMANIGYRTNKFRFDLNGTFFDPVEELLDSAEDFLTAELEGDPLPDNEKRVGDIANLRVNMGITTFLENEVFESSINLRANYVGEKKVGPETTQQFNLGLEGTGLFPEYLVVNSNIIVGLKKLPSAKIAISINNILNVKNLHSFKTISPLKISKDSNIQFQFQLLLLR